MINEQKGQPEPVRDDGTLVSWRLGRKKARAVAGKMCRVTRQCVYDGTATIRSKRLFPEFNYQDE